MSYPKNFIKAALMTLLLPFTSNAQYTTLSDQLTDASNEMFANGNENFIIVDAIRDGIITPESTYSFTYLEGGFTFNQLALAKKYAEAYEQKMKNFFDKFNNGHDFFISITGSKASLKDILNRESAFRKGNRLSKPLDQPKDTKTAANTVVPHTISNTKTTNTDGIIKTMVEEGIITNKHCYTVKWNMNGVYVNGKKLKGTTAEKYKTLFENQAGFKPQKGDDGIVITATP